MSLGTEPEIDFTKSRKSKINRKCYRKCDFQAFVWLKFTLTTDLRLTIVIQQRTFLLNSTLISIFR
jgi:hypothetical protein